MSLASTSFAPPGLALVGFDFLRAEYWPFLLTAPLLLAGGAWGLARRRAERERLVSGPALARLFPGYSRSRALLRVFLAVGAIGLFSFSFLGPVRGYTMREVVRSGLDLVVCIDTSRSMLAQDLRPNRLARAKREVQGLLEHLRGDRVALIAFSGDTREVAPLTHDRTTLAALLEYVDPKENRLGGTDLGSALERALSMFDGRTGAHEAIVLLTDGEDLSGRGLEMAREAADRDIRVYVVGVGTEAGSKIPVGYEQGGEGFVVDPEGEEVISRLDGSSLEAIAEATGGAYLSTERSPTPLEELYEARISRLDRRDIQGSAERVPHDRFQWTLALGLFCMLAELGLRERRPRAERRAFSTLGGSV